MGYWVIFHFAAFFSFFQIFYNEYALLLPSEKSVISIM